MNVPSLVTIAPALDASRYVQGAAEMERANDTIADSTTRVDRAQTQMVAKLNTSANSVDRLQASLDKTFAAQSQHERFVQRINEAHERGRINDQRRIELLDLAQQRYQRATGATQQFAAIQDRANTSSRNFGQVAQQAGFQIQDFAVQVASGQSALVAFAQQAPQFLGIFGTIGAIAGAAVAIGAVALQFLGLGKNASEAAEATNHFGNILDAITPRLTAQGAELNTLAGRYQALAREIGAAAEIAARADINARLQVLAQQRAAMTEAATQFGFSPGLLGRNVEEDATAARRLLRRLDIRESAAEIDRAAQALRAAQQFQITGDVRAFAEALDALGGRYRRLAEDQANTLTNYVRESQAIEMLQAQIAVLRGTATEEQQRLAAAGQGINTIVEQRRAQQLAAEDAADVERRFAEALQSTINALDPAAAATQRYEEQYRVLRTALEQGTISQERYNYLIGVAVDAHQRAIDPMRAYNEELDRQARALRAQIDPQEAYRQRLEELNVLLYAGKISSEEYGAAAEQAFARINNAAQTGRRLSDELGFAFSSAFEDAIVRGQSLRNVLAGIASDLAKIVLRRGVTGPLFNALDPLLSGLGGSVANFFGFGAPQVGRLGGATPSAGFGLGGFLADGGPARAGVPYIVGEEGPELFVPRQTGTVLPNGVGIRGVTGPLFNALDPLLSGLGESVANFFGFGAPQVGQLGGATPSAGFGFGGFLADGGPARAGVPYIVGEEGPELFVPRQSGAVVPNHAIGDFSTSIGRAIGGSLFGGGAGVDIRGPGGSTTMSFGGPRASGGPVSAGTAYLIGEEGPELFVPRQSGAVVPNHAIGGGMVVNQTIQISVGVAQTVRAEIAALLPQIKRQTIDAVADARMRGGSFAAAMGT